MDVEWLRPIVERWLKGQATDADLAVLRAEFLHSSIHTGGGAAITGGVETNEGDFVGHDKTIHNITYNYNFYRPTVEHQLTESFILGRPRPRAPQLEGEVFGQEALKGELLGTLTPGGATLGLTALRGMPGVGKTTLALWAANQPEIEAAFPDGVLWASLGATPDVAGTLRSWLGELGMQATAIQELVTIAERAARLRQLLKERRCLLVVDDVWRAEDASPLLEARGRRCAALVTGRRRQVVRNLVGTDNVGVVGLLEEESALAMLRAHAGQVAFDWLNQRPDPIASSGNAAVALVKELGHLPLALRVAGADMQQRALAGFDPVALLTGLRAGERRLLVLPEARLRAGRLETLSIDAVIRMSYAALPDEDTRRAFRQLAIFGPKPLAFDLSAATAVWGAQPAEAEMRLVALMDGGLIELVGKTEATAAMTNSAAGVHATPGEIYASEQYTLHRVLHAFALDELQASGEEVEVRRTHAFHYLEAGYAANDLLGQGSTGMAVALCRFDRLWPQLERARDWLAVREDEDALYWRSNFPICVSSYLDLRFVPRARIPFLEDAVAAARQLGDREGEGAAFANLGLAYADLGETRRAIKFHEQHLEIARVTGDRLGEAIALGNLGLAYTDLGEPHRAIELHEQALAIDREIGNRRGEGADLSNLGLAYADLGEPLRAVKFHEQHLQITREIGDWRGEGNALGNLGIAYANLGEMQRAIDFYEQHLKIVREISDRQGEAVTAWNLALPYERLEEFGRACELMRITVTYEREIGHLDAELHAARMEEVCRKAGSGSG